MMYLNRLYDEESDVSGSDSSEDEGTDIYTNQGNSLDHVTLRVEDRFINCKLVLSLHAT